LKKAGLKLLGTDAKSVDIAEERGKFSRLLNQLSIRQPEWTLAKNKKEIEEFIYKVGFPVLLRPSYVLSGTRMKIANNWKELEAYMKDIKQEFSKHSIVISKFMKNGIEAELDCASDGKNVIGITMGHIEEAGVHSGDATIFTPFENKAASRMHDIAFTLANELKIKGAFNIQFIIQQEEPYVIELNLRASRSMPFSSKSVGINLIDFAMRGIFKTFDWEGFYEPTHKSFAVKTPQFSWSQLRGAYPYLSPEMKSTERLLPLARVFTMRCIKAGFLQLQTKYPKRRHWFMACPIKKA